MIDKIRKRRLKKLVDFARSESPFYKKLYENIGSWAIDVEVEPTEEQSEAKKRQKDYMHQYYITHRKKQTIKIMDMSSRAIKSRATMAKFRNRLCSYEGEQLKYGTLLMRLHNKIGYSFHDAKLIADKCIIKSD